MAGNETGPRAAMNRLDWLDALRGWAVLGVLVVHSGIGAHCFGLVRKITSLGQYGVQLFFFISALTISLTYESHIRKFGTSAKSQFAWLIKRFFRIAPLYYFAAIFYPLEQIAVYVASHHRNGSTTNLWDIAANLLFVHTWIPSANNSVVPGGWSIGVEMFFYLLVPFIWLIVSVRHRVAVLVVSAAVCMAATEIVCKLSTGSFHVENSTYFYYWFPTQAPVIIVGLIFYYLHGLKGSRSQSSKSAAACLLGFLMMLMVAFYFGTAGNIAPNVAPVFLAIGFVFLVLALRGTVKSIVVNRWAILLGKISFSVYIFHFFVLDLVRGSLQATHLNEAGQILVIPILIALVVLTSALAFISRRFIEEPSIAYGHKLSSSLAVARADQTDCVEPV